MFQKSNSHYVRPYGHLVVPPFSAGGSHSPIGSTMACEPAQLAASGSSSVANTDVDFFRNNVAGAGAFPAMGKEIINLANDLSDSEIGNGHILCPPLDDEDSDDGHLSEIPCVRTLGTRRRASVATSEWPSNRIYKRRKVVSADFARVNALTPCRLDFDSPDGQLVVNVDDPLEKDEKPIIPLTTIQDEVQSLRLQCASQKTANEALLAKQREIEWLHSKGSRDLKASFEKERDALHRKWAADVDSIRASLRNDWVTDVEKVKKDLATGSANEMRSLRSNFEAQKMIQEATASKTEQELKDQTEKQLAASAKALEDIREEYEEKLAELKAEHSKSLEECERKWTTVVHESQKHRDSLETKVKDWESKWRKWANDGKKWKTYLGVKRKFESELNELKNKWTPRMTAAEDALFGPGVSSGKDKAVAEAGTADKAVAEAGTDEKPLVSRSILQPCSNS